jgi:lipopolysaccharide heptosyltransferase I
MIGWIRKKRVLPALDTLEAERVCLIKPSSLGDVVQALPVLTALRKRFPQAHIAWVINRSYAELLEGHDDLNEVIPFARPGRRLCGRQAWRSLAAFRSTLQSRFDLVIDLQGLLRSGLMTWMTASRRRVGLDDAREGARLFYTDVVPVPGEGLPAVDRYWLIAEALGTGDTAKQFKVPCGASESSRADRLLGETRGLRVAIHAGARWSTKRWPEAHFVEIARRLRTVFDVRIVLVGGADEVESAGRIEAALAGDCLNLVGQTTLKGLAAVLSRIHLFITNDSGPMHLAAAMGTPVAAIFTCTSPQRARPYGDGHLIFASRLWCAASYLKKCARMECMREMTPEWVWPALEARVRLLRDGVAA